jgi:hypothetical protein
MYIYCLIINLQYLLKVKVCAKLMIFASYNLHHFHQFPDSCKYVVPLHMAMTSIVYFISGSFFPTTENVFLKREQDKIRFKLNNGKIQHCQCSANTNKRFRISLTVQLYNNIFFTACFTKNYVKDFN